MSAVSVTAAAPKVPANEGVRASRAPVSYATCGAKRTRGGPGATCTRPAGWGTPHPGIGSCKFHAGNTPTGVGPPRWSRRARLERLGVPLAGVNPIDLLGDLVDQAAAVVAYLREKVAELPDVLTEDGPHPMVRLYGVERDRAARVASRPSASGWRNDGCGSTRRSVTGWFAPSSPPLRLPSSASAPPSSRRPLAWRPA